jgi:hypothetical protein
MLTSLGVGRARRRKRRRRLEDVVGAAQFAHLAAQGLQLLAFSFIGLCPSHPLAEGLVVDAEVARHLGDRTSGVGDHPGTAIEQLIGVFLLSCHGLGVPFLQGGSLVSGSPWNLAWLKFHLCRMPRGRRS